LKWRYGFTAILDFDQLAVMKETAAGLRIPGKVQAMASHLNGGVRVLNDEANESRNPQFLASTPGEAFVQHKTVAIHKPERACTARVNQATPGGLQQLPFYSSFQFVFNGRGRASTPRSDKIT
jgi:hypothetical protein